MKIFYLHVPHTLKTGYRPLENIILFPSKYCCCLYLQAPAWPVWCGGSTNMKRSALVKYFSFLLSCFSCQPFLLFLLNQSKSVHLQEPIYVTVALLLLWLWGELLAEHPARVSVPVRQPTDTQGGKSGSQQSTKQQLNTSANLQRQRMIWLVIQKVLLTLSGSLCLPVICQGV